MLACFKFENISSQSGDDCITCVATFQDMGQWRDSTISVLECCSRYFTNIDEQCKVKILAWLGTTGEPVQEAVQLNKNNMFWSMAESYIFTAQGDNEKEANLIPLPKTRPRPRSYLFSFAPKTSIRATPRGGGKPVSIAVPLGCFFCFDGNVTPLPYR